MLDWAGRWHAPGVGRARGPHTARYAVRRPAVAAAVRLTRSVARSHPPCRTPCHHRRGCPPLPGYPVRWATRRFGEHSTLNHIPVQEGFCSSPARRGRPAANGSVSGVPAVADGVRRRWWVESGQHTCPGADAVSAGLVLHGSPRIRTDFTEPPRPACMSIPTRGVTHGRTRARARGVTPRARAARARTAGVSRTSRQAGAHRPPAEISRLR